MTQHPQRATVAAMNSTTVTQHSGGSISIQWWCSIPIFNWMNPMSMDTSLRFHMPPPKPAFSIPEPPPGCKWHYPVPVTSWPDSDPNWRLLLVTETRQDAELYASLGKWEKLAVDNDIILSTSDTYATRKPLPKSLLRAQLEALVQQWRAESELHRLHNRSNHCECKRCNRIRMIAGLG